MNKIISYQESPRGYDLCCGSPLVLIGWQRKHGHNLHLAQIRHRENLRRCRIGVAIIFALFMCVLYGMPMRWGPQVQTFSTAWWSLNLAFTGVCCAVFFYMCAIATEDRQRLVRYIKQHRRFVGLLHSWGYRSPQCVCSFIWTKMSELKNDPLQSGRYVLARNLFAEFCIDAPDFQPLQPSFEELDEIGVSHVMALGLSGIMVA